VSDFYDSEEVSMATTQQTIDVAEMGAKSKDELLVLAHDAGMTDGAALASMRREDLLSRLFQLASAQQSLVASGILEIMDEGYGFLRQVTPQAASGDVYISQSQIRRFGIRTGDTVSGQVRPPKEGERYFGLVRVEKINDADPDQGSSRYRTVFEQ
jgi:transcription termination factor Rho